MSSSSKATDNTGQYKLNVPDKVETTSHSQTNTASGHVTRSPEGALRPTPIKMEVNSPLQSFKLCDGVRMLSTDVNITLP